MNTHTMIISFKDNADTVLVRQLLADTNSVISRELDTLNKWIVEVPEDVYYELMTELDGLPEIKRTSREIQHPPCVSVVPTELRYIPLQKQFMEFMNVPKAWSITKGVSSIGGIILDQGVDTNHPDLHDNCPDGSVGSGTLSGRHGTMCAGVFAKHDGSGVVGVAGGCNFVWGNVSSGEYFSPGPFATAVEDILSRSSAFRTKYRFANLSFAGACAASSVTAVDNTHYIYAAGSHVDDYICVYEGGIAHYGTIKEIAGGNPATFKIEWIGTGPTNSFSSVFLLDSDFCDTVASLKAAGVLSFIAAGNSSSTLPNALTSPDAVMVANGDFSTTSWLQIDSNRGPCITLTAAGEGCLSTATINSLGDYGVTTRTCTGYFVAGSNQVINITASDYYFDTYNYSRITNCSVVSEGTFPYNIVGNTDTTSPFTMTLSAKASATGFFPFVVTRSLYYKLGSGTSFANPNAMAVACLIASVNPALTNDQIVAIMCETATALPSGPNALLGGAGLINAYKAVLKAQKLYVDSDKESGAYAAPPVATLTPDTTYSTGAVNIYYTTDGTAPVLP